MYEHLPNVHSFSLVSRYHHSFIFILKKISLTILVIIITKHSLYMCLLDSLGDIFKASALRPMLSISRNVRMSVCVSVRHTFSLCLTVFLPPLPKVQCLNFLDIRNPWGKVMERSGLRFEHFCS